jgi:hypothetical protein
VRSARWSAAPESDALPEAGRTVFGVQPVDLDEYYSSLFKDAFAQITEPVDPAQLEEAIPRMFEIASDGLVRDLRQRAPEMSPNTGTSDAPSRSGSKHIGDARSILRRW